MIRRAAALALALGLPLGAAASPKLLGFQQLDGWAADDHAAALTAFLETCRDLRDRDWQALCGVAGEAEDARSFFELFFLPVMVEDGADALFTGYYEPELRGSEVPDGRHVAPVYRVPDDLPSEEPWLTRQQIEEGGALKGRGLEIAYVDPVELFFLQIQGSGRVRLPSGQVIRLGYGAANRQPYSSIGQELVARGIYEPHQVSADVIRSWVRRNPVDGRELLWTNRSYVFFREVNEVPPERGPLGAMNRSITPLRSIAVDPSIVPLGAPVWIETEGEDRFRRLMIAQDTGSAIKGAQRADIFFGTGKLAGKRAGRTRDTGRMVMLLPIQRALDMLPQTLADPA
ncbi:murein transglycosylase A [Limimaricola cinnabarinus]|jgi:membrane-bound lytic murein transglycosylase A|uniref:peptidoglycan lytic exotransglycosylase n=1 Tax=Limimaricola cinnabarinus TaxID=1125964 RepID=A0A2G1MHS8_9RHOB|nr:MltA domain-containing protein [Limimaricola cinnabarinus]PHP28305.1 murein transglycosylase [Limimaricola cinnabarinus]